MINIKRYRLILKEDAFGSNKGNLVIKNDSKLVGSNGEKILSYAYCYQKYLMSMLPGVTKHGISISYDLVQDFDRKYAISKLLELCKAYLNKKQVDSQRKLIFIVKYRLYFEDEVDYDESFLKDFIKKLGPMLEKEFGYRRIVIRSNRHSRTQYINAGGASASGEPVATTASIDSGTMFTYYVVVGFK